MPKNKNKLKSNNNRLKFRNKTKKLRKNNKKNDKRKMIFLSTNHTENNSTKC